MRSLISWHVITGFDGHHHHQKSEDTIWLLGSTTKGRGPLADTGSPVDQRNKTLSEYTGYHEEQRLKTDNQT